MFCWYECSSKAPHSVNETFSDQLTEAWWKSSAPTVLLQAPEGTMDPSQVREEGVHVCGEAGALLGRWEWTSSLYRYAHKHVSPLLAYSGEQAIVRFPHSTVYSAIEWELSRENGIIPVALTAFLGETADEIQDKEWRRDLTLLLSCLHINGVTLQVRFHLETSLDDYWLKKKYF